MVTLLKLDNLFPSLKSVVEWRRQPLTMAIAFSRQKDAAAGSHAYHSVFRKSRSRSRPCLMNQKASITCVAIPTGHVFRWHFLIIVHPKALRGAVENPNSSAPKRAPITTSRPVRICPSTCRTILRRRLFSTRVWWVSAIPSSHGNPACLIPDHVLAPVPPSWPEIVMCSEWPFVKEE